MQRGRGVVVVGFLLGAIGGGCGKDDSPSDPARGGSAGSGGSSVNAGRAGAAGASGGSMPVTGGTNSGPAITMAPAGWVRAQDCGGIGDLCPSGIFGCAARSTCQLEGYVCIPAFPPGSTSLPSKSAERPYCAAFTCMSFEEASCFCTGDASEKFADCSSPSALAGLCRGKGRSCETMPCCDGLSCVDAGAGTKLCEETCTTNTGCATGCCADPRDTGVLICSPAEACTNPCKKRGDACVQGSATTPNNCCRGSCVESENPDFAGCRLDCTTHEQCDTGCCQLFSNSTSGFCAPPLYCTCGAVDAPCGRQGTANCCDGTVCAGQSAETLACRKLCTQPGDCPTNCCRALSDNSASICSPAEHCP